MDLILNLAQISPVLIILSHTTAYNFKEFPPQVTSFICPKPCPDFGFDRTWKQKVIWAGKWISFILNRKVKND